MAKVRLELKQETFDQLMRVAVSERRPVDWQAEVLLERALGIRPDDGRTGAIAPESSLPRIEKHTEEAAHVVSA